jgi:hypothetical protein
VLFAKILPKFTYTVFVSVGVARVDRNEPTNLTQFKIDANALNIGNLNIPAGEDADYYDVEIYGQIEYTVYSPPTE